jgi:hypothetical protein
LGQGKTNSLNIITMKKEKVPNEILFQENPKYFTSNEELPFFVIISPVKFLQYIGINFVIIVQIIHRTLELSENRIAS